MLLKMSDLQYIYVPDDYLKRYNDNMMQFKIDNLIHKDLYPKDIPNICSTFYHHDILHHTLCTYFRNIESDQIKDFSTICYIFKHCNLNSHIFNKYNITAYYVPKYVENIYFETCWMKSTLIYDPSLETDLRISRTIPNIDIKYQHVFGDEEILIDGTIYKRIETNTLHEKRIYFDNHDGNIYVEHVDFINHISGANIARKSSMLYKKPFFEYKDLLYDGLNMKLQH